MSRPDNLEASLSEPIQLQSVKGSVVVSVRAQPAARKNALTGVHDGALKIAVTAAPENGKANVAIAELLSERLGVAKSKVKLVSGATARSKKFSVDGISLEEVAKRLSDLGLR